MAYELFGHMDKDWKDQDYTISDKKIWEQNVIGLSYEL
jgi:hypothetical protein